MIDGNIAQKFIVAARDADDPETLLLLLVDNVASAISAAVHMGVDSQPLVDLELHHAPTGLDDLICAPARSAELLERVYDAGRVHLAAEMLGLAQEAFDRTIEQKFRALAQKILQWEQENEVDRQKSPAVARP